MWGVRAGRESRTTLWFLAQELSEEVRKILEVFGGADNKLDFNTLALRKFLSIPQG